MTLITLQKCEQSRALGDVPKSNDAQHAEMDLIKKVVTKAKKYQILNIHTLRVQKNHI